MNAAIIGAHEQQTAIVFKLATVGQFIGITFIHSDFDSMREGEFGLRMFVSKKIDLVMAVEDDCDGGDGKIPIVDHCFTDGNYSSACDQLLLGKDDLFGKIEQIYIAALVSRQEVIMMLGVGTEASDVLDIDGVLGKIFLHSALIVFVLFLLLYLIHAQVEVVEDGLREHLVDESVGLW